MLSESAAAVRLRSNRHGFVKNPTSILFLLTLGPLFSFCKYLTNSFFFWLLVLLLALFEPPICGQNLTKNFLNAQKAIIVINSVLLVIQILGLLTNQANWDRYIGNQKLSTFQLTRRILKYAMQQPEFGLEFICLAIGWIFLFGLKRRGLATIRLFRSFRVLWLQDIPAFHDTFENICLKFGLKKSFLERFVLAQQFVRVSMLGLFNEMFRLTRTTRGGLVLLASLFYFIFVFGLVFFLQTKQEDTASPCFYLGSCLFTLFRLTAFDGNGLDYAYSLLKTGKRIEFFAIMVYMAVTSFGILNGLIGLFGDSFFQASKDTLGKYSYSRRNDVSDDEQDETLAELHSIYPHDDRDGRGIELVSKKSSMYSPVHNQGIVPEHTNPSLKLKIDDVSYDKDKFNDMKRENSISNPDSPATSRTLMHNRRSTSKFSGSQNFDAKLQTITINLEMAITSSDHHEIAINSFNKNVDLLLNDIDYLQSKMNKLLENQNKPKSKKIKKKAASLSVDEGKLSQPAIPTNPSTSIDEEETKNTFDDRNSNSSAIQDVSTENDIQLVNNDITNDEPMADDNNLNNQDDNIDNNPPSVGQNDQYEDVAFTVDIGEANNENNIEFNSKSDDMSL
eukprot:gene6329-8714_t